MKKIFYGFTLVAVMLFTMAGTAWLLAGRANTPVADKVSEAAGIINRVFIGNYDETAVGDAAVQGMIDALDDRWSYYISAEDYSAYQSTVTNTYVGVGMMVESQLDGDGLKVASVTAGGPAEAAGIQPGDILTQIEDQKVSALSRDEAVDLVRGEAGTQVQLTLTRDGTSYTSTVTRAAVREQVVSQQMLDGNVGYIRIKNFDEDSASQAIAAVDASIEAGATALLFDVRYNPGGLKTELLKLLDYLIEDGVPLFTSRMTGADPVTDYAKDGHAVDLPMAVLVNGDSYSAAEFFAAALQELEQAVIVGEATCGKGYFQITYPLSDGSAMAISSGEYFTPNGISLTDVGISPDAVIALTEDQAYLCYYDSLAVEEDPQLQKALEVLRSMGNT